VTGPVLFFQRPYPSANAALLTGPRPILVDPGFGADVPALEAWLHSVGTPPGHLSLVVNTHFDCDHVGANHALAERHGLVFAASADEAALVNARDSEACRARWLHQPVEPYRVEQALRDGEVISTGETDWRVIATPGHTAGHISLYAADRQVLVTGDAVHSDDLGWIDPRRPGVLDEADSTIATLAALPIAIAYSGHGPPTADPQAAFAAARRRLAGWRSAPERMAWHGVKRVFAYGLMVEDGLLEAEVVPYLLACPWFHDYAAYPFAMAPGEFAAQILREMLRAGAARWAEGRLIAGSPFVSPPKGWAKAPTEPALWPR
jgi:glyoxylase-like metal-dependent hydrolase (beta-lactamase superfamily II)